MARAGSDLCRLLGRGRMGQAPVRGMSRGAFALLRRHVHHPLLDARKSSLIRGCSYLETFLMRVIWKCNDERS